MSIGFLKRLRGLIAARVEHLPQNSDEQHRLYHFTAFLMLGIPALAGFGIYHLAMARIALGTLCVGLAFSIVVAYGVMPWLRSGVLVYRINMAMFAGLLLYMLAQGGDGGSMALWMFTFPLVTFFLLGTREGLAWTFAFALGAAAVLWVLPRWVPVHRYEGEFTVRFFSAFLVDSVLAGWFEYLRQHFRSGMEMERQKLIEEQAALQEALAKVKQLSGMLPICSSCKKVRDDQGYWTQIEAFIRDHSDAEFSHGLCPGCAQELYPGIYRHHIP